jgi:hypothetical protein
MTGYCGADAGASGQPNHCADGNPDATSNAAKVERSIRIRASRCGCADSCARSRAGSSKDKSVATPMALVEHGYARAVFFGNADVVLSFAQLNRFLADRGESPDVFLHASLNELDLFTRVKTV